MDNSILQYLNTRNNPNMNYEDEANQMGYQPNAMPSYGDPSQFKKGGKVRKKDLRTMAEAIRAKGRKGDTILAHINPQEAQMLYQAGGAGTIHPETGLPEFSFTTNPWKAIKNTFKDPKRLLADTVGAAGAILGAATGNPMIGGAISGALSSAIKGKKGDNPLLGALKGAGYGAGVSAIGSGLASLGATNVGNALAGQGSLGVYNLSNYGTPAFGTQTAPSGISQLKSIISGGSQLSGAMPSNSNQLTGLDVNNLSKEQLANLSNEELANVATRRQYMNQLVPKTFSEKAVDYLSKPETMLTLGTTGLSMYNNNQTAKEAKAERAESKIDRALNREILKGKVEKSPEEEAALKRRYAAAMKLSPEEIQAQNEYLKLLEGESESRLFENIKQKGRFRKAHTPADFARTGKWFSYYDNPEFTGAPQFKKGGTVVEKTIVEVIKKPRGQIHHPFIQLFKPQIETGEPVEIEEEFEDDMIHDTNPIANYLSGVTGGQDDKIPAMLSDGEYIIDASTVSDLGDGNNKAGAKKLDIAIKKIRKHKRGGTLKLPPKAKNITDYLKGN